MRVKTITFGSSIQIKPYQHAHVQMTAELGRGETPKEALEELRKMVAEELLVTRDGVEVVRQVRARTGSFADLLFWEK